MATDTRKKRPASSTDGSKSKKPRLSESTSKDTPAAPARTNFSSLISTQETNFPRGGGTSLSQVEVKEIRAEAAKDLFESKKRRASDGQAVSAAAGTDGKKRKKFDNEKKKKGRNGEIAVKKVSNPDQLRVEHLNYKRMSEGTNVLAQIISIRALELIVSLPNQLLAHIPITAISSYFTASLQASATKAAAGVDSDQEEDEESDDDDLPDLSSMFQVGQFLNAQVSSTKTTDVARKTLHQSQKADEQYRLSRRVLLTLDPAVCYAKMKKSDLVHGLVLYNAVIKSVEDNGYVLDMGVEGVTAFLSFDQAKKATDDRSLTVGQLIPCKILKMSGNGRTCTVSALPTDVENAILTNAPSIDAILPMTLVSAVVTALSPSGLNVKFLGFFDGTIDLYHLPLASAISNDLAKHYKVGQKVKARVLWSTNRSDSLNSTEKTLALTCLPHLVNSKSLHELKEAFPVGLLLQSVRVARVESEFGLVCEILGPKEGDPSVPAFVHLSRVSDEHLQSIPSSSTGGKWSPGTMHPARVVGFADVDGLVQLSLQPSVLEQRFLKVQDVKIGETVKATVKGLTEHALFLSISGSVDGIVWANHFSDVKLKHPERRFAIGSTVKARIFSSDPEKFRVALTLKKSLLNSELPVLSSIEDAQVGQDLDAAVSKVMDKGLFVELFGGLRAFVPIAEASDDYLKTLEGHFTVGSALRIRLTKVDVPNKQLMGSVRKAMTDAKPVASTSKVATEDISVKDLVVGTKCSAVVKDVHKSNYLLALHPSGAKALLSFKAIAGEKDITQDKASSLFSVGQTLEDLVLVSKNDDKALAILGYHLTAAQEKKGKSKTKAEAMPTSISAGINFNQVAVGQQYSGRVTGRTNNGFSVQLARNLKGRVHLTDSTDDYALVDDSFLPDKTIVQCQVVNLDLDQKRVDLSLRASVVEPEASLPAKDPIVGGLDDLLVGQKIRGFVRSVAQTGLFVALGRDVTARVQIKELFDDFVQDWKSKFTVGQLVEGKIAKIDPLRNQIELTLRKKSDPKVQSGKTEQSFGDFEAGQQVETVIKNIQPFGAFLRIKGTQISGLCHKSEIADDAGDTWETLIQQGQEARAVITEIDTEKKRISFSMKASKLGEGDQQETDDASEEETEEEDEEDGSSDEELEIFLGDDSTKDVDMESAEDTMDIDPAPIKPTAKASTKNVPALSVGRSFDWKGSMSTRVPVPGAIEASASEEEDSDSAPTKTEKSRKKRSELEDKTGQMATDAPASEAEFERLLLGSANSSFLWIQYMSFYMQQSNLAKARQIAQRALQIISYREEEEKRNVWLAVLNLENAFGTEESLEDAFKNASQATEPKHMHLSLIQILEHSGKYKEAEDVFERLLKKASQSSKVWTLYGQFLFERQRGEDARALLPRGLKSLPKRKHVKTITKFAQMEFKIGDAERGRTIFSGIIDTYPKRLDLLSVFIDQEAKIGNTSAVEQLFERGLEQKLSSKKAKFLFKKWINIARAEGDDDMVEKVKARAAEYVNSLQA